MSPNQKQWHHLDARASIDSLGFAPVDLGELRQGGQLMQAGGPLVALDLAKIVPPPTC